MRKYIIIAFSLLAILSSCRQGPSARKITQTMEHSLGKNISDLSQTLVHDMGFMPGVQLDYKIRYDMGDTLITVVPSMADQSKVGGVFMSINISDPERALEVYKEFRELLKDSHPFYGAKIIYWEPEYYEYSSTDPATIDTITAAYLKNNRINFNERWHEVEDYNDRNSVALIRHDRFGTWTVNVIYRSSMAMDF